MSLALAEAAPLRADIRLARAIKQFDDDLSAEERATLQSYSTHVFKSPPGTQDVMQLTAEIDSRAARKRRGGRCFGPRLTNILQAIQQFAAIGDVVLGATQNITACGVWSLVRMTLLSIVNLSSYLEKTSAFLMVAGQSAPRYQDMTLLYPKSKNLQRQLSEYFIVIVRFCRHVMQMSRKPVWEQLLSFPSESDLKNYQSELDTWARSIKEEVVLLTSQTIKEQNSGIRSLLKRSEYRSHLQRQKARLRVLHACSTYDHQTPWRQIRKLGKTAWLDGLPEYQNWKSRMDSCTLVCSGKLGSGKSVLLANIVDDLNLHVADSRCPVAYFFSQHDISQSLKASTVIRSLVRQLLHTVPDLTTLEEFVDDTGSVRDDERITTMLRRVIPPNFKAFIVLDGLDECDGPEARALIQWLGRLQHEFVLLVCLSSRLEAGNAARIALDQLAKPATIAIPQENPDIGAFVHAELEARLVSEALTIGDPVLILEIEDALVRGAQGMFLWVALQIECLCTAKTDEAIRQALLDLPRDLSQTFSRIMQKSGELGEDYQTRTLKLVTAAHRPLKAEEVREALSVVPGDAEWNPARLLNNIQSALACCGCLLTVDEEDTTVRLVHGSVRQFLLGEFQASAAPRFTMEHANETMGNIIVTYLNYGVFDNQVSTTVVPRLPGLAEAAPRRIVNSIAAQSHVRRLALVLLKSRKQPGFDMGKLLADAGRPFTSASAHQFQFLLYAKDYWQMHICYVSDHQTTMRSLVLQLARRKTVALNPVDMESRLLVQAMQKGHKSTIELLLSCGVNTESKYGNQGQSLLSWAAEKGEEAVVKVLLEGGADIESKDFTGKTPLFWAVKRRQEAVIKVLLERGANIESNDSTGQTPLSWAMEAEEAVLKLLLERSVNIELKDSNNTVLLWAARKGQEAIIKVLLKRGADIESKDYTGQTPLSWAAEMGKEAVVKVLLERGADIESKDFAGRTPLIWAARRGQEAVAKVLLERGADIESKDSTGQTPLSWAAINGKEAVIKVLLERGADIESRDLDGQTPLSCAAEMGKVAVIKVLLERGADIESKDLDGKTALSCAEEMGQEAVLKVLLERWAQRASGSGSRIQV